MDTVVVFGAPRSGTTFLLRCLRKLKSTVCKSGTLVPSVVPHLAGRGADEKSIERALRESLSRCFDAYLNSDYHSRFQALEYWWRAPFQFDRLRDVVRHGSRPLPNRFVYKEPFFALSPELIVEGLPDAKIIYIYRDGRDVANSLVESYDVLTDQELTHLRSAEMRLGRAYDEQYVPWWVEEGRDEEFIQSSPFVRAIWMWAYMAQRCHEYFPSIDASIRSTQVLEIQYEKFMRSPHEMGDRILEHLGANHTRAFERHLDAARTSSIGKHEQRPWAERQVAEDLASSVLTALGYTLTVPIDSRAQRTDA